MSKERIKKLAHLPNERGFKFVGVTIGDELINCHVDIGVDKNYHAYNDRNWPCFDQLKGWLHIQNTDEPK